MKIRSSHWCSRIEIKSSHWQELKKKKEALSSTGGGNHTWMVKQAGSRAHPGSMTHWLYNLTQCLSHKSSINP